MALVLSARTTRVKHGRDSEPAEPSPVENVWRRVEDLWMTRHARYSLTKSFRLSSRAVVDAAFVRSFAWRHLTVH